MGDKSSPGNKVEKDEGAVKLCHRTPMGIGKNVGVDLSKSIRVLEKIDSMSLGNTMPKLPLTESTLGQTRINICNNNDSFRCRG